VCNILLHTQKNLYFLLSCHPLLSLCFWDSGHSLEVDKRINTVWEVVEAKAIKVPVCSPILYYLYIVLSVFSNTPLSAHCLQCISQYSIICTLSLAYSPTLYYLDAVSSIFSNTPLSLYCPQGILQHSIICMPFPVCPPTPYYLHAVPSTFPNTPLSACCLQYALQHSLSAHFSQHVLLVFESLVQRSAKKNRNWTGPQLVFVGPWSQYKGNTLWRSMDTHKHLWPLTMLSKVLQSHMNVCKCMWTPSDTCEHLCNALHAFALLWTTSAVLGPIGIWIDGPLEWHSLV